MDYQLWNHFGAIVKESNNREELIQECDENQYVYDAVMRETVYDGLLELL